MINHQPDAPTCTLCQLSQGELFHQEHRDFFRCSVCDFVFVSASHFVSPDEEKAVYDLHQNSPSDPRYRKFLSRLFDPLSQQLEPQSSGLDFGSGPGPTLSVMLEEAGHLMQIYDPFFASEPAPWGQQFDFITTTEVVEHLHQPRQELDRLWDCLKPNGLLGIMTKRIPDQQSFATWHYKSDPTHVSFFSLETFQWLEAHWNASLMAPRSDVAIFRKPLA